MRLHNPMKSPEVVAKVRATIKANGHSGPILTVEQKKKGADATRHRMLTNNPMKNPATAIRAFQNRKDRGKMTRVEKLVMSLGAEYGLKFVGGGDLVVGFKVPDFIVEGTNKLVESWAADKTEDWGRTADWQNKRRLLYAENGYEVLFLEVPPGIGKEKQKDLKRKIAEYVYNGVVVTEVLKVTPEATPKIWARLAGTKDLPVRVYNFEVEGTHTYVANSMVVHNCDTDYSVHSRKSVKEIVREVVSVATPAVKWVWLTGGEPTIHNLQPLLSELHSVGLRVALATAGVAKVRRGMGMAQEESMPPKIEEGFDFVSVSPHHIDNNFVQRRGEQVNLVFGLNDLTPEECEPVRKELEAGFSDRFVTPCDGKPETFQQCLDWVYRYGGWRIGNQAHKQWGLK
jgi:organic radical activating enzyme